MCVHFVHTRTFLIFVATFSPRRKKLSITLLIIRFSLNISINVIIYYYPFWEEGEPMYGLKIGFLFFEVFYYRKIDVCRDRVIWVKEKESVGNEFTSIKNEL